MKEGIILKKRVLRIRDFNSTVILFKKMCAESVQNGGYSCAKSENSKNFKIKK